MILLSVLLYTLIAIGSFWLLWVFYVAVMHLKIVRDQGKLSKLAYVFGIPTLYLGLAIDTFVNWFVMSFVFMEIPKETLVTKRLSRLWKDDPNSWRGKLARQMSNVLLDAFDPSGDHID